MKVGLFGAASVVMVKREWVEKNDPKLEIKSHERFFITSHVAERAKLTAQEVRSHWSVENKNHYRKDVSSWREDDHRHRRVNVAQNLALMRSALLATIPFDEKQGLEDCLRGYDWKPSQAIRTVQKSLPI